MKQNRTKMNENGLTARQKEALPHFVGCSSYEEGIRRSGVSKTMFYSWLQDPVFKAEMKRLQDELFEDALASLKRNSNKAAITLANLLDSKNEAIRRATANDILNHVVRYREIEEIETRLEALEKTLKLQ